MWRYVADIETRETESGVITTRILSDGSRKPLTQIAPDHATAWRWFSPLIGCKHWVRDAR